jgi:Mg2+-importing ATPase
VAADQQFWNRPIATLRAELADRESGLADAEAASRLRQAGPNRMADWRRPALWRQFLERFRNPLILVLIAASSLSAITGDAASFAVVVAIIAMSVTIDFVQEVRADRTIEALRHSVALRSRVRRGGVETTIAAEGLAPGDRVLLTAGDQVPADGRVLAARNFFVNQAFLSGEPYPVEKRPGDPARPAEGLADAGNAVFAGSSVISGSAEILVCATGGSTQFGAISARLAPRPPETAFERGIRQFGGLMLRLTVVLVLFVLAVNVLFHRPWLDSILFALALAVGLTPELLPMIVTVTLARGARALAERRVVVKRLQAIYNLGAIDVLCTDKTGTLTEARISLIGSVDWRGVESARALSLAAVNSRFETGLKSPLDDAILARAPAGPDGWRKIDEVPYDFQRRRVSVLAEGGEGRVLIVKGAPEDVLALCIEVESTSGETAAFTPAWRARQLDRVAEFGREGLRCLAVAIRPVAPDLAHAGLGDETALRFVGLLTFHDPAKPTASDAVRDLRRLGIAVKIISGDRSEVCEHLCRTLGMPVAGVLTGTEVAGMSDEALFAAAESATLFCRVTPQQKQRIILALKQRGHAVGFLGDGINDAPALRAADVGISVDGAADVAKEAAEVILLDHDLHVLRDGILAGRRAYANVVKYILMGTSSNFGNMFSMAAAALVLPFLPMLPIQVLLNNLLYDVSEIGVPLDRVDEEEVARPHGWDNRYVRQFMLMIGPVSSIFDFLTFFVMYWLFQGQETPFQTGWFVESLLTQSLVIFIIRTKRHAWRSKPAPALAVLSCSVALVAVVVPFSPLAALFGFVPLPTVYFWLLGCLVAAYLGVAETAKIAFHHRYPAA